MQSSGSLSNSVFERRTSTGSCFFTPLRRDFEQIFGQIVSIRVKTLSNTNLVGPRHIKREKRLLPVDVRRSKTSLLKLPIFPNSYLLDSDLSGSLHNRRNTYFFAVFGRAKARVKRARSIRHALRLPSFAWKTRNNNAWYAGYVVRWIALSDGQGVTLGNFSWNFCRLLARIVTVTWSQPGESIK